MSVPVRSIRTNVPGERFALSERVHTTPSTVAAPDLSAPDGRGSSNAPQSTPFLVRFDLEGRSWPVDVVKPRSFTTREAAVAPRRTVTATLTCADPLTISVQAWAHQVDGDGRQRFSILDEDDEVSALLLQVAVGVTSGTRTS